MLPACFHSFMVVETVSDEDMNLQFSFEEYHNVGFHAISIFSIISAISA
jgi:hypothetical protein